MLFWINLHQERSKPNIWNSKMYKYRKSLKSYVSKIPKINSQINLKPTRIYAILYEKTTRRVYWINFTKHVPKMLIFQYIMICLKLNLLCIWLYSKIKVCSSLKSSNLFVKTLNFVEFPSNLIVKDNAWPDFIGCSLVIDCSIRLLTSKTADLWK